MRCGRCKQIEPPDKDDRLTEGARFFLDGDQVIVALGKRDCGEESACMPWMRAASRPTSPRATTTSTAAEFAGQKMELFAIPGPQSVPPQPAYIAETVPLTVGRGHRATCITSRC